MNENKVIDKAPDSKNSLNIKGAASIISICIGFSLLSIVDNTELTYCLTGSKGLKNAAYILGIGFAANLFLFLPALIFGIGFIKDGINLLRFKKVVEENDMPYPEHLGKKLPVLLIILGVFLTGIIGVGGILSGGNSTKLDNHRYCLKRCRRETPNGYALFLDVISDIREGEYNTVTVDNIWIEKNSVTGSIDNKSEFTPCAFSAEIGWREGEKYCRMFNDDNANYYSTSKEIDFSKTHGIEVYIYKNSGFIKGTEYYCED